VCDTYSDNPAAQYLEKSMHEYCIGPGKGTEECMCLQFPVEAKDWCDANSALCPQFSPDLCPIQEIMYTSGTDVIVTEFSECDPYGCWYGPCRSSPHTSLIPPSMATFQMSGSCSGVCIMASGQNSVTEPSNASPLPPGQYKVNEFLVADCCASPNGCVKPALLAAPDLSLQLPADRALEGVVMLNNEGDIGTSWQVKSRSAGWISLLPSYGFVGGREAVQQLVEWDRAAFGIDPGTNRTATVTIEYWDGQNSLTKQTTDLVFALVLGASVAPQTVQKFGFVGV